MNGLGRWASADVGGTAAPFDRDRRARFLVLTATTKKKSATSQNLRSSQRVRKGRRAAEIPRARPPRRGTRLLATGAGLKRETMRLKPGESRAEQRSDTTNSPSCPPCVMKDTELEKL